MRTQVTFRADRFDPPLSEDAPLDAAHGRALARWLAGELAAVPGIAVGAPARDEWGWRFSLRAGAQRLALTVGQVPAPAPEWLVAVVPTVRLRSRGAGRVDQGALEHALGALHEVLSRAGGIRDLGWHEAAAFDRGVAAPGATPFTPPSWERA